MKLYEIVDAMQQVEQLLEQGADVQDTLDALELELEEKVENIAKVVKNYEAMAAARKAEAKRLKEAAEKDEAKADRLKEYLRFYLQRLGKKKVETNIFTVRLQKGRESIVVDEEKLPDEYWVVERKPMGKTVLKELLKEKGEIPGVSVVQGEESLVIR